MSEIDEVKILVNTQFTRNTKVDYAKGNPVINCIFRQFDTDLSGDFDNKEWDNYQKYLNFQKKNINKISTEKTDKEKELDDILLKLSKLEEEFEKFAKFDKFNEILKFEDKHEIIRDGYLKEAEVPEGSYIFYAKPFGMGIFDKRKNCFTGKIYEMGYIQGLDKLSSKEREAYIDMLNYELDLAEKMTENGNEYTRLINQYKKTIALSDIEKSGYEIPEGKEEEFVNLWNKTNPFNAQIKKLEKEMLDIHYKGNVGESDKKKIQLLQAQIEQLENAADSWSLRNLPEKQQQKLRENFVKIATSVIAEEGGNQTIQSSVCFRAGGENISINGALTGAATSESGAEINAMLEVEYSKGDFSIAPNISARFDNQYANFSYGASARYKNFGLSFQKTLYSADVNKFQNNQADTKVKNIEQDGCSEHQENCNDSQTNCSNPLESTKIELSHFMGKEKYNIQNGVELEINNYGKNISTNSSANFELLKTKYYQMSINPSLNTSYNIDLKTFMLEPSVNMQAEYKNHNLRAATALTYSVNKMYEDGNNNTTKIYGINGDLTYKKVSFEGGVTKTTSKQNDSATYTAGAKYNMNFGEIGVKYMHTTETTKVEDFSKISHQNQFAIYFQTTLDKLKNLFK